MKSFKIAAMLLAVALFTGIGATQAVAAMGEKCGAGSVPAKCGSGKCGSGKCGDGSKCGSGEKAAAKCGGKKKTPAKCGGEKKTPSKGKCGAGKCG